MGWLSEARGKIKFPWEIIGRFYEAQAERHMTNGVKHVLIQSDFCANPGKTLPPRCNSLKKELKSTGTSSIQIYLKILLLQILQEGRKTLFL